MMKDFEFANEMKKRIKIGKTIIDGRTIFNIELIDSILTSDEAFDFLDYLKTKNSDGRIKVGDRIRLERVKRNWTLHDLSKKSKVCVSAISRAENGITIPTALIKQRLATAFKMTIDELEG